MGNFLEVLGIPAMLGVSFGLMAFTTFVYDTLDVCTRLGRYIIEELTGWRSRYGRWVATLVTAGAPLIFVMQKVTDAQGKAIPAWKLFWPLFGASNQLLAALTLLGVTVWLARTYRARWVWLVTGLPTVWMYVMSLWALAVLIRGGWFTSEGTRWTDPVPWVAAVLFGLGALMIVEAVRALAFEPAPPGPPSGTLVPETIPSA